MLGNGSHPNETPGILPGAFPGKRGGIRKLGGGCSEPLPKMTMDVFLFYQKRRVSNQIRAWLLWYGAGVIILLRSQGSVASCTGLGSTAPWPSPAVECSLVLVVERPPQSSTGDRLGSSYAILGVEFNYIPSTGKPYVCVDQQPCQISDGFKRNGSWRRQMCSGIESCQRDSGFRVMFLVNSLLPLRNYKTPVLTSL